MQKPNLTKICRTVKASTIKHSPEISLVLELPEW